MQPAAIRVCAAGMSAFAISSHTSSEAPVAATGAKFTWGANSFAEMKSLAPGFVSVKDDNILRGMVKLYPIYRLVSWMPIVRKMAEKILIFQKKSSS